MGDRVPLDRDTLEELYEQAPCGYVSTEPDGTIVHANRTFLDWLGLDDTVIGTSFRDLLTVGGRIFFETNYVPLLRLQGEVRDVALDLSRHDGGVLPVLLSSRLTERGDGRTVVRSTVFDASVRHEHERQLRDARRRAEASERQIREVALLLQRSLLAGHLTAGPGYTIETRYRPGVDDLEVGGDWYDSFILPGREVVNVSVGDVVGRGISAACAMGQLRAALRGIAGSGVGPGRILDQLDAFAERVPDAHTATVVCAEIDPADRHVRYACAGHLPPLLLDPDGSTTYLWEGRSTPLATLPQTEGRAEGELRAAPGSGLLLYTDGLVERADRGLDDGMAVLAETTSRLAARPPGELVDGLLAELLRDEGVRDDVCLLFVRL